MLLALNRNHQVINVLVELTPSLHVQIILDSVFALAANCCLNALWLPHKSKHIDGHQDSPAPEKAVMYMPPIAHSIFFFFHCIHRLITGQMHKLSHHTLFYWGNACKNDANLPNRMFGVSFRLIARVLPEQSKKKKATFGCLGIDGVCF